MTTEKTTLELEFLLRIPTDQVQQARKALESVEIDFHPETQMCVLDRERELIFHGADQHHTVGPPINFAEDIPDLIEGLNEYLDELGITPRLPEYRPEWTLEQRHEMLRLATREVLWVGFRPLVSDIFPRDWESWREYIRGFPSLFPPE